MSATPPSPASPTWPRGGWALGAILAAGLLLRLTYLLEILPQPDFDRPQFEAQYHDYWARALLSGDWTPPPGVTDPEIRERPFFRPPGYPYFLALVYALCGPGYLLPRLVQQALGLLNCGLAYILAARAGGRRCGLLTAAFLATSWSLIFSETEWMEPVLLITLLLAALLVLTRAAGGWTVRTAALAGLLLGLAALVRPNALVLVPVVLGWTAGWADDPQRSPHPTRFQRLNFLRSRAWFQPALALLAALSLTLSPAAVRNFWVARDWVLISSNGGINFFVGTHPQSDGVTPGVPELGELTQMTGWDSFDHPKIAAAIARHVGRPLKDSEVSAYFSRRAWSYLRAQPGAVLELLARKFALFWGPAEVSNDRVIAVERETSRTLRLGLDFATILALALVGLSWLGVRQRLPAPAVEAADGASPAVPQRAIFALIALFIAAYSASFLPFFAAARFRVPLIPLLFVFAGWGLAQLWDAVQAHKLRRVGVWLLLFAAIRGVTGIAWVPYTPEREVWHFRRGLLYRDRGDPAQAIAEFQRAVAARPTHAEAQFALADELARAGDLRAAIREYQRTLELLPDSVVVHNNLATALARAGDLPGAIASWERALELAPERLSLLSNLAFALATRTEPRASDRERAVTLAERACALTAHREPALLNTLAIAYEAAGRPADAALARRQAQALGASGVEPPLIK